MIEIEISETVQIRNKCLINSINKLPEKDRIIILDGITKLDTVTRQKWFFAISGRLLLKKDLNEDELFSLLSTCNSIVKKIQKKLTEKIKEGT